MHKRERARERWHAHERTYADMRLTGVDREGARVRTQIPAHGRHAFNSAAANGAAMLVWDFQNELSISTVHHITTGTPCYRFNQICTFICAAHMHDYRGHKDQLQRRRWGGRCSGGVGGNAGDSDCPVC